MRRHDCPFYQCSPQSRFYVLPSIFFGGLPLGTPCQGCEALTAEAKSAKLLAAEAKGARFLTGGTKSASLLTAKVASFPPSTSSEIALARVYFFINRDAVRVVPVIIRGYSPFCSNRKLRAWRYTGSLT